MYEACCEICFSIDIIFPDNMEITDSLNKDLTDNDNDYCDVQYAQPKKSVRLYECGKSDEGKTTKIFRNLSVTTESQLNCSSNKLLC